MRPLARLAAAPALALPLLACAPAPPPNLFVVVLDTTRTDRLTPYGYARDTTPHLAHFARDAIRFDRAWSTSSWTVPSHASLFTGLLPMTHQATQESEWLADGFDTLAERLAGAGWQTAAFSNNAWVGPQTNLLQGFEHVEELWRIPGPEGERRTREAVRHWLAARDPKRPFFVFVNLMEPHWPYTAPRALQDRFIDPAVPEARRRAANFGTVEWYLSGGHVAPELQALRSDLYDAEIASADETLGGLLASLEDQGLSDETLTVVTSDHGELLGEHGHQGHAFTLYDGVVHIALLVRPPGGVPGGAVRDDPVQLTDLHATLVAAAGLAPGGDARSVGRDLLAGPAPADRPIVAEYYRPDQYLAYFPEEARRDGKLRPYERRIRSIQVGSDKLVWGSDGHDELYDLAEDPGEEHDRLAGSPDTAGRLEQRLTELVESHQAPTPAAVPHPEPDAATRERLRELGYVR